MSRSGSFCHCRMRTASGAGVVGPRISATSTTAVAVSEHGEHRQPDLPVERRQYARAESPGSARSRATAVMRSISAGARLRQRGERHQEEERNLLHDQAGRHGEAEPVLHDQKVGRALAAPPAARRGGRGGPRRDQEGEAEGGGRVRHAEQRRDQPLQRGEDARPAPAGDEQDDDRSRRSPWRRARSRG